jgi:ABC-type lipoprotein export system ATPase subunit
VTTHSGAGEPLVAGEQVGRTYGSGATATVALQAVSFMVPEGARIAIMGPSGSGKSTLVHLMAGLDQPTVGSLSWPAIGSPEVLRPGPVAVIFQGPSLLPPLTVAENVALPLLLAGTDEDDAARLAAAALERLDLDTLSEKLPEEISGGQAQRVALARALAGSPRLILADEPTGQLDHVVGAAVTETLLEAADHAGAGLVVATHDPAIAERLEDRWQMHDGVLEIPVRARA